MIIYEIYCKHNVNKVNNVLLKKFNERHLIIAKNNTKLCI